jgi:uncharacterized protein (DUF427 family)
MPAAAEKQERISIEPFDGVVTVTFSDAIIASTDKAKVLKEPGSDPVFYIPFEDIYFDFLQKTSTTTRCPIKGLATHWRVSAVGEGEEDIMCAYETPNPVAAEIARHGAFDPERARTEIVPDDGSKRPLIA